MNDKTKQRIEKEAEEFSSKMNSYGDRVVADISYTKGATAEHPRAWNEAIDSVKDMLVEMMEDEENEGLAALENAYRKLESIKR